MEMMTTSPQGRVMIETLEGFRPSAYLDSIGVPTLGYGHTLGVHIGDSCTQQMADEWLADDLGTAEKAVNALVGVTLSQQQFDALVSLVFNIGQGNFRTSSLLRTLNQGEYVSAAAKFTQWQNAGGLPLPGLLIRRLRERDVFLYGYQEAA